MESISQTQQILLGAEGILFLAGIYLWVFRAPSSPRIGFNWSATIPDALLLVWGVLFGAFIGQLAGMSAMKAAPSVFEPNEALRFLVLGSSFQFGCLAGWFAMHAFLRTRGRPLPTMNSSPARPVASVPAGLATFLRVLPVVITVGLLWAIVLRAVGIPVEQQDLVGVFERADSTIEFAALLFLATIIAPLTEELVFRAGLFRALQSYIGRIAAIALSSALFALLHGSWVGFAPLFCLGVVFCLSYERTGNIAVPMIAHGLFNLNSIILILVLPAELLQ